MVRSIDKHACAEHIAASKGGGVDVLCVHSMIKRQKVARPWPHLLHRFLPSFLLQAVCQPTCKGRTLYRATIFTPVFLHTVVLLGWDYPFYNVFEGDGTVELCASLKGRVTLGDNLAIINLLTENGTAASKWVQMGGGGGGGGGGGVSDWRAWNN